LSIVHCLALKQCPRCLCLKIADDLQQAILKRGVDKAEYCHLCMLSFRHLWIV
jgi:hypothetical protein